MMVGLPFPPLKIQKHPNMSLEVNVSPRQRFGSDCPSSLSLHLGSHRTSISWTSKGPRLRLAVSSLCSSVKVRVLTVFVDLHKLETTTGSR